MEKLRTELKHRYCVHLSKHWSLSQWVTGLFYIFSCSIHWTSVNNFIRI